MMSKTRLLWGLMVLIEIRGNWCQTRTADDCDFLQRVSSLSYPRLSREPTPSDTRTTVDEQSNVTFSCEGAWGRNRKFTRFCRGDFAEDINLESAEDLKMKLTLMMEWQIDGMRHSNSTENHALTERGIEISTNCTFSDAATAQLYDILMQGSSFCRQRITDDLIPSCNSVISIKRVLANNNVQVQCSIRPQLCLDDEFTDDSRSVYLRLQGLLGPPPGLRVGVHNSTTLYVLWGPPTTLSGVPILYYSVSINNLVSVTTVNVTTANQPSINPNMTSLDLSTVGSIGYLHGPISCESVEFTVRAWNSVGEGANSSVVYSQESLQSVKIYTALHSPDTICVLCEFTSTSEAQGCQATLLEEMSLTTSTTIKTVQILKTQQSAEAFDCFSRLYAGNYTVNVREIECTGGIGLTLFEHSHISLLNGLTRSSEVPTTVTGASNASTIGLSVIVALLVIVVMVSLLVVFILIVILKKANTKNNRITINGDFSPRGTQHSIGDQDPPQDTDTGQELIYENDYDGRPAFDNNSLPSTEYSYTVVAHPGRLNPKNTVDSDNGMDMKPCVAYGRTTH